MAWWLGSRNAHKWRNMNILITINSHIYSHASAIKASFMSHRWSSSATASTETPRLYILYPWMDLDGQYNRKRFIRHEIVWIIIRQIRGDYAVPNTLPSSAHQRIRWTDEVRWLVKKPPTTTITLIMWRRILPLPASAAPATAFSPKSWGPSHFAIKPTTTQRSVHTRRWESPDR